MLLNLRKFLSGPRSHFLAFLLCALMLPPVAVVFVAVAGMVNQERAMEAAVSSYVQDLAESTAYHIGSDPTYGVWNNFSFLGDEHLRYPFFSWGPSIPGWLALIDNNGRVIVASPGAMNIAAIWRSDLPVGQAVKIEDKQGAQYTLAIYPVRGNSRGSYVIAAVSWANLLGNLVIVAKLWPALIVIMAMGSFLAIRVLWTRLMLPLKSIADEIDDLRLGKDVPKKLDDYSVREIESVHKALLRFSEAAIERDHLRDKYVRDVVQAQEKERMDMAREIHDGPLQDVTALLQQLHMTLEDNSDNPRIKKTEVIARSVVRELRALCDELAPPWMDLGLTEALTELAERLSQAYDVQVSADFEDDVREMHVENETTLSLLRIIQEAVSNAVRHGQASEVHIQLRKEYDKLTLDINDDGKGFDSANINHETLRLEGHRGLASMTERMALIGGKLKIESSPGNGTHITGTFKV